MKMTKEQKKELFFKIFKKEFEDSVYDEPYDYLLNMFDPMLSCCYCPLESKSCYKYKANNCVGSIKEALEKGDIQL